MRSAGSRAPSPSRSSLSRPAEAKPAAEPAAETSAQSIPVEFELGYRFVDVTGNDDMYRTQINDRPGVLLRSLHVGLRPSLSTALWTTSASTPPTWGRDRRDRCAWRPGRSTRFRLDFSWRRTDLFSALPAFANPLLDEGIIPGQHTYNRSRDIYDATLQILPGKTLTPILGFTRNMYRGPGTTTYHVGENEFLLNEGVRAIDDEYRIGLGFNTKLVQGAVIQGYRRYRFTDTVVAGAGGQRAATCRSRSSGRRSRPTASTAPPTSKTNTPGHQRLGQGEPASRS